MDELEELMQSLDEFNSRLQKVEEICASTKAVDHRGISVVASEGLRGGGTIDKSRPFALDFGGLREEKLRVAEKEFIVFFAEGEGEHFRTNVVDLVNTVVRLSGFVESFIEVRKQILELRQKIELFTLYERLYKAETEIVQLTEKVDGYEEALRSEADKEVRQNGAETKEDGETKT